MKTINLKEILHANKDFPECFFQDNIEKAILEAMHKACMQSIDLCIDNTVAFSSAKSVEAYRAAKVQTHVDFTRLEAVKKQVLWE